MGLFGGGNTDVQTDVEVLAQNDIYFSPTTEISINTDSFAAVINSVGRLFDQTLSDGVSVIESVTNNIGGIGSGIGSGIGNGLNGAGVNVGFGLMAGVSIGALVWVLK